MSSHELVSSLENLKMVVRGDSDESRGTLAHASSSTEETSKEYINNDDHCPNFIDNADKAYIILLNVFRYLSRKDLRSAAQVCKLWNLVGCDKIFWKRISLNNCIVHDCNMMIQSLKKYQTETLDLRGMSFFKTERGSSMVTSYTDLVTSIIHYLELPSKWSNLCEALTEVTTLTEIIIDDCYTEDLTLLAKGSPQLKSISAYRIRKNSDFSSAYERDSILDVTFLKKMKDLLTLKLDNKQSTELIFDESSSETTDNIDLKLTKLSINRVVNLSCIEHILPSTLITLELGEFHFLSSSFCNNVLPKLVNLKRLRLEMCDNADLTTMLVEKLSKLPNLSELELINFEISNGFQKALAECINLKSLLLIPKYSRHIQNKHPFSNSLILSGVKKLEKSLQAFVWVITDQMISFEQINRLKIYRVFGNVTESIPVYTQKVDGLRINIISFDNVQSVLWPELKFKIFKVRFPQTWKLSFENIKM